MKNGPIKLMAQLAGLLALGHRVAFESDYQDLVEVTLYEACGPGHGHFRGKTINEALEKACASVRAASDGNGADE